MRTLIAIPVLLAVPALAGPLNPKWVAADADWVVHIDMEAIAASAIGQYIRAREAEFDADFRKAEQRLGLDLFRDIKSFTVYGAAARPGDGLVIVAASDAIDASIEKIKTEAEYQTQQENGTTFHIWTDTRGRRRGSRYAVVRPGDDDSSRIVFIGESKDQLLLGLRVVDGDEPSRPATDPGPANGSLVFVHASQLPEALRSDPHSGRFVKLVEGVLVDIGETAGKVYADLTLTASSTENASSLTQAAQGFLAMGRLMAQSQPGATTTLCDSITFSTEGKNVAAHWQHEITALIEALGRHGAPKAKMKEGNAGADSPNKAAGAR